MKGKLLTPRCPYCHQFSELVGGKEIYPHRADLWVKKFYLCRVDDAYVGTHINTDIPLGRLADAALRKAKSQAHAAFDPLWQDGSRTRQQAYSLLAKALGIKTGDCHIGQFDLALCLRTVDLCNSREIFRSL
jgi:hypothetical protein